METEKVVLEGSIPECQGHNGTGGAGDRVVFLKARFSLSPSKLEQSNIYSPHCLWIPGSVGGTLPL